MYFCDKQYTPVICRINHKMSGNNKLLVNYQQQRFVLYDYAKRSRVGAQSCTYQAFSVIAFQWWIPGDHMTWNGPTEQKNELNRFNNENSLQYHHVVVQFYPWFRFSFLLFLGMVMYDNNMIMSLKQKKRKFEPRIKLNYNIYTIINQSRGLSKTHINESTG